MPLKKIIDNPWQLALISTLFLYAIAYLAYGFYYGWLDDVQLVALYSGLFTPKGLPGPDHHILISHVFIWLYKLYPQIPWYGIVHHLLLAISISLLNFHLLLKIKQKNRSFYFRLFAILCFQFIFLLEVISFFNYTFISMITAAVGLYSFTYHTSKTVKILSVFLLIFGILTRIETAVFILFFVLLKILLDNYKLIFRPKMIVPLIAVLISSGIVIFIKTNPSQESFKFLIKNDAVILSIHEANNIELQAENPKDSIKLEALLTWNFYDKYAINDTFLYRVSEGYYSKNTLSKYKSYKQIKNKLRRVYQSAFRYPNIYSGYNWGVKFLVILLVQVLLLLALLFFSKAKFQRKIRNTALTIIGWLIVLFVLALVLKLEDRIVFPVLLLLGFFVIESVVEVDFKDFFKGKYWSVLIGILLVGVVYQGFRLSEFANQKNRELQKKRAIVSEINNNFDNKTLIFDFLSIYLVHDTPFKQVKLNSKNNYRVAAHYWLLAYDAIQEYYKELCGSDRIDKIIDHYYERKEDVIFLHHYYDKNTLEAYLKIIYDKDYTFSKIDNADSSELSGITYSYIKYPVWFNYYKLE